MKDVATQQKSQLFNIFLENVRREIEVQGLTHEALAQRSGVLIRASITRLLTKPPKTVTISTVEAFARGLGVDDPLDLLRPNFVSRA